MSTHPIGDLIEQLGQARDDGRIAAADAVAQLIAADPTLSPFGAHQQLRSWRGAAGRYAYAAPAPTAGRVDARTLTARPPIRFRRRVTGGAA
jgi:hypothetical protein